MAHSSNSNIIINGGTFNSAQGDFHINNNKDSEYGLQILRLGASLGAIHDSAERYPSPNCHPDTRKAVRQIILDWIHNESSSSSVFWLYGPAGAGKTAILQAIAEFLCNQSESDQNFGGSFFFSRGKSGCDQGRFLFSTIAYQLALNLPGLRRHVNRIMEKNPTLHTKSMDVQLEKLIVSAFKDLSPLPPHSYLVIIDGLDECHDKLEQQLILQLLCETITVHKLPLRFLIGSRPESHIRDSFDQDSLRTVTRRVVLDGAFNPGRDIQVFLQDGFARMCAKNPILSNVKQPWPEEGIIDLLVQRSSGQFIYAATVLKFVRADFCSPTKRLALVLKPDPTSFSDLDQLYTQILSVYPNEMNIVQVLGFVIGIGTGRSSEVIEDILEMEEGELKLVLCGLSSLMEDENGESLDKEVTSYFIPDFAHASFSDYLFDSSRSGRFHVNQQEYEKQIAIRSFALIIQSIRSWRISSITRVLHTTTWDYFTSHLPGRFDRSPKVVKEAIMADINDLVQKFWKTSSDGADGAPFFEMRRLLKILQNISDTANFHSFDNRMIRAKFNITVDGYRRMFDQSLSKSKDLGDMLRFLPGIVVQNHMSMQGMADLYRIKPDLLERLIKSTMEPLKSSPGSYYKLDDYLSGFLEDQDRSQHYYCDPMLQHISICRRFLSLVDGSNTFDLQSHDLSDYVNFYFYNHLCAGTTGFLSAQNISNDHPAVEILHGLETMAYCFNKNSSGYVFCLAGSILRVTLRWANTLNPRLKVAAPKPSLTINQHQKKKGLTVSVSNIDLMERVCHLTNKIYREMLYIATHERMTIIKMDGLHHAHERTPFSPTSQYSIVLSWYLLAWISVDGRIPCSFTNFITTLELSGPLYISPDIYHTQLAEYSLQILNQFPFQRRLTVPDWDSTKEHLPRALPTQMIFHLLRSIRLDHLFDYSKEVILDILAIFINWLQGLGSERPRDLCDRFQSELRRHKARFERITS